MNSEKFPPYLKVVLEDGENEYTAPECRIFTIRELRLVTNWLYFDSMCKTHDMSETWFMDRIREEHLDSVFYKKVHRDVMAVPIELRMFVRDRQLQSNEWRLDSIMLTTRLSPKRINVSIYEFEFDDTIDNSSVLAETQISRRDVINRWRGERE